MLIMQRNLRQQNTVSLNIEKYDAILHCSVFDHVILYYYLQSFILYPVLHGLKFHVPYKNCLFCSKIYVIILYDTKLYISYHIQFTCIQFYHIIRYQINTISYKIKSFYIMQSYISYCISKYMIICVLPWCIVFSYIMFYHGILCYV